MDTAQGPVLIREVDDAFEIDTHTGLGDVWSACDQLETNGLIDLIG